MPPVQRMRVLLLGGSGFIGSRLVRALLDAGHHVTCGVRAPLRSSGCSTVEVDFTRDSNESDWLPRLTHIDVVINAVGILRQRGAATFEALHVTAPIALFSACERGGVRKVIQISALGADEHAASAYHRSKKQADDRLASMRTPWVIVQPSLTYGEGGASAGLFTMLAALPLVPVPGDGGQCVQPIHVDDLVAAVVHLLETSAFDNKRIAAVGPRPVTLRELLERLRSAMGLRPAHVVEVPMALVRAVATLGEHIPGVLLDRESLAMLVRGNVAAADTITALLGRAPRSVESFVDRASARHVLICARLAWLLPLLRVSVALVWIVTGIVSLGIYPVAESYALLARVGLTGALASLALYGAALLDLALGLGVLLMRRRRWLWRAQMLVIAAYTLIITIALPEFWLHPYGPVLKNLPLLAALLMLHEFDEKPQWNT